MQTSIAIIKTKQRNYNYLTMSVHVPNNLTNYEKETWILLVLENTQKRFTIPTIAHIDMNAKLSNLKTLRKYMEIKGWNKF